MYTHQGDKKENIKYPQDNDEVHGALRFNSLKRIRVHIHPPEFTYMIATAHVIIGGAIGVAVGTVTHSPTVALTGALIAGIASHFVLDSIPHLDHPPAPQKDGHVVWTPAIWAWAFFDSTVALVVTALLWVNYFDFPLLTPFIVGAVGGALPDAIDNVPFWNKWLRPLPGFKQFHAFHEWLHHIWLQFFTPTLSNQWPSWSILGIVTQLIAIGISLWYLFKA